MNLYKWRWNVILRWVAIPLILFAAWQIGVYAGRRGISYIEVLSGVMGIAGIIILGRGHDGLRFGYFVWVVLLGIGYRTADLSNGIRLHPLVILSNVLMLILLIYKLGEERGSIRIFIPRWLWFFTAFWIWGLILAIARGTRTTDTVLLLFSYLLLIPVFVLTYHLVTKPRDWRLAVVLFYAVGTFIAFMGTVEYFFPSIGSILPGFVGVGANGTDQFGFSRATFSFYGGPVATFICALALPMILVLYHWYPKKSARFVIFASAAMMIVGIYLGGYRSIWATVALVFITVFALQRNIARLAMVLGVLALLVLISPEAGINRFSSLIMAAEGQFVDTSAEKRYDRADQALLMAIAHPFGSGLAASGWAHTDIIQIAAETGIGGAVAFAFGLAHLINLLARRYWRTKEPFELALLGSLAVVVSIYIFQTVTVLPQLAAPTYFIWALSEAWLERQRVAEKEMQTKAAVVTLSEPELSPQPLLPTPTRSTP